MPPPPMAVRLAADLRLSADGSAVRTSPVPGQLQAASVPNADSLGMQLRHAASVLYIMFVTVIALKYALLVSQ